MQPSAGYRARRRTRLRRDSGCVRVFVDEGLPMAALLRHLHTHGILPQFMARLLDAQDGQGPEASRGTGGPSVFSPSSPGSATIAEPLTERELDVLRLLAAGQ